MPQPTAEFSEEERVRIRHALGFLNVQEAQTFVLGIPAGVETQFIIEGAMVRVLKAAETKARELLGRLESIEAQMGDDLELLAVDGVGSIKVRATEMKELRREYQYWQRGLANLLGVQVNPFDQRFRDTGINVPVMA